MPEDARPVDGSIPVQDAPPPLPGPQDLRKPSRRRNGVVKALGITLRVLLVAAGLAVTVLGFVRFVDTYHGTAEYRATPFCATPAAKPGADCRARESGRVTRKWVARDGDSTTHNLAVARETAPTETYGVGEAFYDDVDTDTTVELTILRGRVIELGYHGHRAQYSNIPVMDIATFGALLAVGMIVAICGAVRWRDDAGKITIGLAVLVWFMASLGGGILVAAQWSIVLSLVLGIISWLVTALIAWAFAANATEGF